MPGPYFTYELEPGVFCSVDTTGGDSIPLVFINRWQITEEAYLELKAHTIPAIYPDNSLGVNEDTFPISS